MTCQRFPLLKVCYPGGLNVNVDYDRMLIFLLPASVWMVCVRVFLYERLIEILVIRFEWTSAISSKHFSASNLRLFCIALKENNQREQCRSILKSNCYFAVAQVKSLHTQNAFELAAGLVLFRTPQFCRFAFQSIRFGINRKEKKREIRGNKPMLWCLSTSETD
ncbi:hypothetical protein VNO77_16880 [Canavalia gladiata]|uniref:Uncharacterized protein n=1 Tax=Canavalia gladiata TaxID=3824 RepID=A0AAN9LHZ0_CANGL